MSVYYCESCLTNQGTYIDGGNLPVALPGQPNVGFNIGIGFNGYVFSIQIQSDGKILVGGYFDEYNGTSVGYGLIRLESDGSIDNSFDVGTGFYNNSYGILGEIYSIQIQSDGKILIGGFFDEYYGTSVGQGLIRLESDGSIDTSFNVGSGFYINFYPDIGYIKSIQIQSDGKILVGGTFDEYNGTSVGSGLIRLESDGSIDTSFDVGSGFYINSYGDIGYIQYIQIQSDGKILVCGYFDEYNGTSVGYSLIRLESDGSIDTSFDVGNGFNNGEVLSIQIQSDGKILVGGGFDEYSGTSVGYGLIRLESDGSIDNSFIIGTGFNGGVWSTQIQSDGKILVGGGFSTYSGVSINYIIRLNTDGSIDTSFVIGTGFNNQVSTISLQSDGKILVGGFFSEYNGFLSNAICQINTNSFDKTIIYATDFRCYEPLLEVIGNLNPSFNIGNGFNDTVQTIQLQSDGKILVGGWFTSYSGVSRNRIIRLNNDYTIDNSFVIGTGFNSTVQSIALQSDGKILVGGVFTSYSGVSRNRIIRLNSDGSIDTSFVIGTGFSNYVLNINLQSDGKIIISGQFTSYSGSTSKYIIQLNSDGSKDNGFFIGTGFNSDVFTSIIQPDGKILAGGTFSLYNEFFAGGLNTNFLPTPISSIINDSIKDLNGDIIVGYGTGIRKVDPISGSTIYDVTTDNTVNSLEVLSGSSILVGGLFNFYGGNTNYGLVKIDSLGREDESFSVGEGFGLAILTTKELTDGKILVGGNFVSYGETQVDKSFNRGFNSGVLSMVEQPDGKVLVGGLFTSYSGVSRNRIIRLNIDGSIDTSFVIGTGFNNSVQIIQLQPDGKILAGGTFSTYSGVSSNRIIRLNTDGSIDNSFVIGTGFVNNVYSITLQSDGKILVGGAFSSYSGVSRNDIIRLNTDGSIDDSFVNGTGFSGGSTTVYAITLQPDGKILVGGDFTSYSGVSRNDIIRLNTDGSIDTSFVIGTGFNNRVRTIQLQPDGKILVGGYFTSYSGVSRNYIIRLNTDGSIDTSFVIGTGFNSSVQTIQLQSDGKILVGGDFTLYSGVSINRSILLNTDGSIDLSFSLTGSTGAANGGVYGFLPKSGFTYVYGNFTSYNSSSQLYLSKISYIYTPTTPFGRYSRLNSDGSLDLTFSAGTGFDNTVNKIDTQSDGKILVAGDFTQYSGISTNKIVRLNADNTLDTTFNDVGYFNGNINSFDIQSDGKIIVGGGFTSFSNDMISFDNTVNTIQIQSDGKILVGGYLTSYSGVSSNRIIRLNNDYTIDTSFVIGTGFNNAVQSMSLQSDGKILVGGSFTSYSGVSRSRIIRLNTDGSIDTSFAIGTGFNNDVNTISIQSDGKIIVGGGFGSYSGVTRNRIIRLNTDGSVDNSFVIGTGFSSTVNTIELQSDGKIIVGGSFTSYSGVSRSRIIRLNTNGSVDTSFVIGTGFGGTSVEVRDIELQSDNKILVGGNFASYSGVSSNDIIRLNTDGSIDTSFVIGTGFGGTVNTISLQSDGKILVGGGFSSYNGVAVNDIVILFTNGSLIGVGRTNNGFINSIAVKTDNSVLVGGSFTSYENFSVGRFVPLTKELIYGIGALRIARLNANGTFDTTFSADTGFNNTVTDVSIQPNGKVFVSGIFTSYSGITSNRFARLNSDGTYDPTFDVNPGFNGDTYTITQVSSDYVLVGGSFTSYDSISTTRLVQLNLQSSTGTSANRIIRLNSDGSVDTSFVIGTGFSANTYGGQLNEITLQSDGKILIGGFFDKYNGTSVGSNLIRLESNGTIDTTFDVGTGLNGLGDSIEVQSDGKILVGGQFTSYNGVSINRIVRLNTDGSVDDSFDIGSGFNSSVQTIQLQPDGKILVGGSFVTVADLSAPRFAELLSVGIQGEYVAIELFSDCEECNGYIIPISANTEYDECRICNDVAVSVDPPHPVWTGLNGGSVTQMNAVLLGGNGLNS